MHRADGLPGLDQTLHDLDALEKKYDEGLRIDQTRRALEANARIAADTAGIARYYRGLADKEMFVKIYAAGEFPWALPVHLPPYLMELLLASAQVLLALVRKKIAAAGPDYLKQRMPQGWLTEEMADRLHRYYLSCEPDLAFDVLIYGVNAPRGTTFDAFKTSGDHLYAKILEAQSVDTYYGWLRQCIQSARRSGGFENAVFTMQSRGGRVLSDAQLDEEVRATYRDGLDNPDDGIVFLEIDPDNQPSVHNLLLLSRFVGAGEPVPPVLVRDPRDLWFEGDRLYFRRQGQSGRIGKVISRIVDPDLQAFIHKMNAASQPGAVAHLQKIYARPHLWPDLSKHLAGYYLVDKSSITELARETQAQMAPKTWIVDENHMTAYRRDPGLLRQLAVKPLHGMSSKGVKVAPELAAVEKLYARETILGQELLRATPVMPNINRELSDPDAAAGICSEIRLLLHAASPAVPRSPRRARCILALSRCHYASKDPARKIKGDAAGRGWFSNMGAILAVKGELGILEKREAGLGMGPVCWVD